MERTEREEGKFEVNPGKIKSPLCSEGGLSGGGSGPPGERWAKAGQWWSFKVSCESFSCS